MNWCFVYGCDPGAGVNAKTKFAEDIIRVFRVNSDISDNYIDIPRVFSQVKTTDCKLEIATSNLAQQLRLYRTCDVVGPKVLLYGFDSKRNETMAGTRRLFIEFAQKHLGFSDEQVILID